MVWVRVAFHENDGNHENDEDSSDSYKQGVECWIRGNHANHENDENRENPGCKPRVPKPRVRNIRINRHDSSREHLHRKTESWVRKTKACIGSEKQANKKHIPFFSKSLHLKIRNHEKSCNCNCKKLMRILREYVSCNCILLEKQGNCNCNAN